ncbi:MAG: protein translocase subunit SecF [Clostridiaceae bacterium]|nr:protein translocase subunit SecF [Clostridiaceae bacterium]
MKIYDFMKHRKLWFGISGAAIAIGLIFMAIYGLNFGIDFTGGTAIQANIGKSFEISEVRNITDKFDKEAIVTYAGQNKDIALVKTKIALDVSQQGEVIKAFQDKFGIQQTNIQFETIGPTIGSELAKQALLALFLANLGILIYVSFRFEWKFGVAAIIALLHDVLIMLVVYSVAQIAINASFIAAILTIVGYSINDTIVVFDRIRENKKHLKKIDHSNLVNKSISETVVRSINTSITTLVTILALYILGVPAIKDFALPLIVGILSGTYSSIFIASPLWALLDQKVKVGGAH